MAKLSLNSFANARRGDNVKRAGRERRQIGVHGLTKTENWAEIKQI